MKHLAEAKQDIAARVKLTDSLKNSKKNLRPIYLSPFEICLKIEQTKETHQLRCSSAPPSLQVL